MMDPLDLSTMDLLDLSTMGLLDLSTMDLLDFQELVHPQSFLQRMLDQNSNLRKTHQQMLDPDNHL
jgi:hypothetical protein